MPLPLTDPDHTLYKEEDEILRNCSRFAARHRIHIKLPGHSPSHAMDRCRRQRPGLPRTYNLFTGALLKELLKTVSTIPASTGYDAFGRI